MLGYLNIISDICSILSFILAIFITQKIIKIGINIKTKGNENISAGRDINVK